MNYLCTFARDTNAEVVYDLQNQAWTLYTPMKAREFVSALSNLGVKIADTSELQIWLDAISQQQSSNGRH